MEQYQIHICTDFFLKSLSAELKIDIRDITILFVTEDMASNEARITAGKTLQ